MTESPTDAPKQFTEEDKRWLRNRHREQIQEAREEALLCCEHYEEQQADDGEIGEELYRDLIGATSSYWMETRASVEGSVYEEEYPDTRGLFKQVDDADAAVWEIDELPPERFVEHIRAIDAVVTDSDLLEMER